MFVTMPSLFLLMFRQAGALRTVLWVDGTFQCRKCLLQISFFWGSGNGGRDIRAPCFLYVEVDSVTLHLFEVCTCPTLPQAQTTHTAGPWTKG